MGILNSTSQVIKNNKKFKEWEQQDADKQAQREALYQKKQLDEETLKKAAAKGKVIMDVVDIMDTHSEEVAENTETAVMPIAQLAPILGLLGSTIGAGFIGWSKIKNIGKKFDEFHATDLGKEYNRLYNNLSSALLQETKGLDFLEETKFEFAGAFPELFNPDAFKNIGTDETKEKISSLVKQITDLKNAENNKKIFDSITLKSLKIPKFAKASLLAIVGITAGVFVLSNVLGAKLQVRASRIARWQSREDLKDPKYFVQYTPEQIAQAQKNLETNKENKEEKKKGISFKGKLAPMGGGLLGAGLFGKKDENKFEKRNKGFFKTMGSTIKDNKNYKEWAQNYNPQDKMVQGELSQQDLIEAQKDKEIIQRITKKINNNAEEYSEDMEVAAGVLIGGTPWLGLGISSLLNLFINKTGIAKNGEIKAFEKALKGLEESKQEHLRNVRKNFLEATEKNEKGFVAKLKNLNAGKDYCMQMLNASIVRKDGKFDIAQSLSKAFNFLKSTKASRNILIGVTGTLLTTIAGAFIGLKLQKASARAGRYKAKQKIANDPRNFVGYSEKDFEEVKNVKAQKKTFGEKVKETITFIPRVIKDYIEYEKFRKTEAKQDKKLLNELVKLDVTEEQLNEAKDLQRKVFTTFENVDDKSQEYSESIEALNEMTMPLLPVIGFGTAVAPIVIGLVKAYKKGGAGVAEAVTGFFANHTKILNNKISKKILGEMAQNATKLTADSQDFKLGKLVSDTIAQARERAGKDGNEIEELIKLITENKTLKTMKISDLESMCGIKLATNLGSDASLLDFINDLIQKYNLTELNGGKIPNFETIGTLFIKAKEKAGEDGNQLKELLNLIIEDEKYAQYLNLKPTDFLDEFTLSQVPEEYSEMLDLSFADIIKMIPEDKIPNIKLGEKPNLTFLSNFIEEVNKLTKATIVQGSLREYIKGLDGNNPITLILKKIANSKMTNDQALKIYQNIETIIKNIPSKDLNKIFTCAFEAFKKNPVEFMQAIQDGKLKNIIASKTAINVAAITGGTWTALSLVLTYALEATLAGMQKNAGKLGVMTALEELSDDRYYANENSNKEKAPVVNQNSNLANKPRSEMLEKWIKNNQNK
ncbi:MAG: hypothetical protein IKU37_06755 [Candidatus Gastranaerophilales bacterium]|nr:hypothetical protein [Candidatus Gastranaerophilales bacterium]